MPVGYTVDQLTFSDGTAVDIPPNSITVIVGPNNAGKSCALREVQQFIAANPATTTSVVTAVRASTSGSMDELREYLKAYSVKTRVPSDNPQVKFPGGGGLPLSQLTPYWGTGQLGPLSGAFIYFLNADNRTQLIGSVPSYDTIHDAPQLPLQFLYADSDLANRLSSASAEAFGAPLYLNRIAGGQIHLQIGDLPDPEKLPADPEYLAKVRELPMIQARAME